MKLSKIIFLLSLIVAFGSASMNAQVYFIERGLTIGQMLPRSPKNYLNIHGSKGLFFSDGAKHVKFNVESSDPSISSSNMKIDFYAGVFLDIVCEGVYSYVNYVPTTNIKMFYNALEKINLMQVVESTNRNSDNQPHLSLVSESVQKALPEATLPDEYGNQAVDAATVTELLIESICQLEMEVKRQAEVIENLKKLHKNNKSNTEKL